MSSRSPTTARLEHLPPRLLPILYFSIARLALLLACLALALDPRGLGGFFYHPRLLAVVHLVTLGWITCSILGALYVVGPTALRLTMPARVGDYAALVATVVGIGGMVSHFWMEEPSGMAWSALMVSVAIAGVGVRTLRALPYAPIPRAVKLHLVLAFANVVGAATLGVLIGFDKTHHFLPGFVLANVYAHAHLAAIGWASMMVVGVGYRMFPMLLPSAMPGDRSMYLTAALLEVGVVGLAVALLLRHGSVPLFALIVAAGFGVFGGQIAWMRRRRRPAPAALRRPDYGVGHVMMAMASLAITVALGLALAVAPPSELALRVAMAYGVFGLLGFLGQMVAGVESRLLPIFAWYWAFANTGFRGPAPSPHEMSLWRVQQAGFYLWVAGVPALGIGLFLNVPAVVTAGAALLSAAVLAGATDTTAVLRHAYRVGRNAPDA